MKKFIITTIAALASIWFVATTSSCGEERNGWTIAGTLEGVADSTLFIEEPSGAAWIIIDSIKTNGDGEFAFTAKKPYAKGQAIYRLRLNDRAVYFPIEGSESLTLTARGEDMDKVHRLSGSEAAEGFNKVDSIINEAVNRVGEAKAPNDSLMLHGLADVIVNDTTCIVGYYTIYRPIRDRFIFTPDNRMKAGLIGAVANRYQTSRPGDARAAETEALYKNAKARIRGNRKGGGASIEATVAGRPYVEFVRQDEKGVPHDLNETLDRGGVTIVNFVCYDSAESPANTVALGEVYEMYKDKGLEIYQIGFDANQAYWKQNAAAMPWTTVYNGPADGAEILVTYNVNPIDGAPTSLIFDKNGELVARVTNPAEIKDTVVKFL